jgi:hypothetical protein
MGMSATTLELGELREQEGRHEENTGTWDERMAAIRRRFDAAEDRVTGERRRGAVVAAGGRKLTYITPPTIERLRGRYGHLFGVR